MLQGRIIKGVGGLYFVSTNKGLIECSVRGIFRKNKIIPTVGDYVKLDLLEENKGIIEEILERKNILIRPRVANIDCAIITFSIISPNINIDLLDRFLILAESQNIENIIICINKADLAKKEDINMIKQLYESLYPLIFTSTINNEGIKELKELINKKVTVFAGPSGVGKSSLINSILPNVSLKTGDISKKIERGKHTTRQVELLEAWEDTYIVDSPGFTSLTIDFIEENKMQYYFKEFREFLGECKFYNCKHIHEPECAIKAQIGKNISEQRYNRYTKLLNELTERK
ncbi:ribosome small subunit-dependent GTPase A [[Clostridium] colinum]|uniref:ribosome small subunit-dependent GTPase A n=1 Tax=[Clostridium] colinum TaxID=36835 RepID=UPI002023FC38|nr:ribosome small subunit-dependent GTPase A [[Clostridium] colinum]